MGTPSPWGSRPVGDPAGRLRRTSRARRWPPTHLLDHPRGAAPGALEVASASRVLPAHDAASVSDVIPRGAPSHHWTLGCTPSRLGHLARVLPPAALDASSRPLGAWPALVPSRCRVQLSQLTPERSSRFLPTALGLPRSASRRTPDVPVALHPAPQGYAPCHGPPVGLVICTLAPPPSGSSLHRSMACSRLLPRD